MVDSLGFKWKRKSPLMAAGWMSIALSVALGQAAGLQGAPAPPTNAAAPAIAFEAVTVKANKSSDKNAGLRSPHDSDSITATNLPLFYIVLFTYNFNHVNLVEGLPDWTATERFDVTAKVAPADLDTFHKLTGAQRMVMFQRVLADRFKLQVHREPREVPVYNLVVAAGGVKMKQAKPGDPYPNGLEDTYGKNMVISEPGKLEAQAGVMTDLAALLSHLGERQVVDKTGLAGKYDFTLLWPPDQAEISNPGGLGSPPSDASGPSLFTALRDQLGLKLEPATGPVEYFVVDHIERPLEN
jgi:uncharacterized protein (TIGR03435 family)